MVETALSGSSTVLDFVRYHRRMPGTKIGCREGDCGACTILAGDFENDTLIYRNVNSCLMPLGNAHGRHIVTVEGINMNELSPVQESLVETNGTQCGFCTVGFVMSLTGFAMHPKAQSVGESIDYMNGNICRCTGYKSIERAAALIAGKVTGKPENETIAWLVSNKFIPPYFLEIKKRLQLLKEQPEVPGSSPTSDQIIIGGGTDLFVQKYDEIKKASITLLAGDDALKKIYIEGSVCHIGSSVTVAAFAESSVIQKLFPGLDHYIRLIASTPIRNMATMGGNLVNASPIGDMSIFFLALNADLVLNKNGGKRKIKLHDFFLDYKKTAMEKNEKVDEIIFNIPDGDSFNKAGTYFNFEKVSKRTWLDIASVNSACQLIVNAEGVITTFHLSAGGIAPVPKYLFNTVSFLTGKKLSKEIISEAISVMQNEISPISDARGTSAYKKLLIRQLLIAHFIKFFGMQDMIRDTLKSKAHA
jgi:xanthine dehydrogenase small subunit